ncbi:hypothetical protein NP233_g5803 [Leucocoprinus birnbaumii]|uniref:Uncharacterized protein n=1 Tax=Leucocoprinus birnbaumii TaxID=56174 RepID=A0AAD5VYA4_9AGAR|nr:hypothetical protein NP233_g5803 [Leucocoprinus birnbaumii]
MDGPCSTDGQTYRSPAASSSTSCSSSILQASSIISTALSSIAESPEESKASDVKRHNRRHRTKRTPSLSTSAKPSTSLIPLFKRLSHKAEYTTTTSATNQLAGAGACCNGRIACGSFATEPFDSMSVMKEMVAPEEWDEYDEYEMEIYDDGEGDFYESRGRSWSCSSREACDEGGNLLVPSITRTFSISSLRPPTNSPPHRSTTQATDSGTLQVPPRRFKRKRSYARIPRPRSSTDYREQASLANQFNPNALVDLEKTSKFYEAEVEYHAEVVHGSASWSLSSAVQRQIIWLLILQEKQRWDLSGEDLTVYCLETRVEIQSAN